MKKATLSEIIFALEQVKDIHGDKEVCLLSLANSVSEESLFVEFMDYSTHTIEVKTYDDVCSSKEKCEHKNKFSYNHSYHTICKDCGEEVE